MNCLSNIILNWLLSFFEVGAHRSIRLSCFISEDDEFFHFIDEVLCFIEKVDERRYKRVLREIYRIVNTNRIERGSGDYRRGNRMCSINHNANKEITTNDVVYFASIIIHEATHGYLYSKGFGYEGEQRAAIERICVTEENRFLLRAAEYYPEIANSFIREFNADDWSESWNSSKLKNLRVQLLRVIRS